jgi:2-polyprenyl-3-methyl-5-hydroxy-6-metoxy-1,4-benzoquinol methylase
MPTSDPHSITPMVTVLTNLAPKRILDIGCGFGKYGFLAREYLDVWAERYTPGEWQIRIDGIEAYDRYRNPVHDYVYNTITYSTAQEQLPKAGEYDVIVIADMIEHVDLQVAKDLVVECFKHAPVVIISTPREFYAQQESFGNTYEMHRCHFKAEHYPPGTHMHTIRALACDIFVGSRTPLDPKVFHFTDPVDYVYFRSRRKLGMLGLPLSLALKGFCRLLS